MIVFEEEGIKQNFKIILNTRGVIILTKGFMSSKYKEIYSRLYPEVRDITIKNKVVVTEFNIDNIKLSFGDEDEAEAVKNLIMLGKTNTQALNNYIGADSSHLELEHIDYEDLANDVTLNRFSRAKPASSPVSDDIDSSRVGMSSSDTLDYILSKRMHKINQQQQQQQQQQPTQSQPFSPSASTPVPGITPPPIGMNCFSYFAFIDGKQQGPYDEKQFKALVDYGLVNADTPVWKAGMVQWQPAHSVAETAKFFFPSSPLTPPPPTSIQ